MKKNILFLAFIFISLIVLHAKELKFSDCYGKWKIDKAFIVSEDFLVIGDMAKEEAESYIGKVITYRSNELFSNILGILENILQMLPIIFMISVIGTVVLKNLALLRKGLIGIQ